MFLDKRFRNTLMIPLQDEKVMPLWGNILSNLLWTLTDEYDGTFYSSYFGFPPLANPHFSEVDPSMTKNYQTRLSAESLDIQTANQCLYGVFEINAAHWLPKCLWLWLSCYVWLSLHHHNSIIEAKKEKVGLSQKRPRFARIKGGKNPYYPYQKSVRKIKAEGIKGEIWRVTWKMEKSRRRARREKERKGH